MQFFSSNSYEVRGGENRKWRWIFAFDRCVDQLTHVKTRYPLTSITWPYRGLKLTAHPCQVFFWSWPLTRCWFWIGSRAHVWLTKWKQGRIVRKPVNACAGLNVNRIITFSSMQMFSLLFCNYLYGDYWNSKQHRRPRRWIRLIRDISLLTIALWFWPFKIKDNVWECFENCCKCYLWKIISIKMAYLMFTLRYFDASRFLEVV